MISIFYSLSAMTYQKKIDRCVHNGRYVIYVWVKEGPGTCDILRTTRNADSRSRCTLKLRVKSNTKAMRIQIPLIFRLGGRWGKMNWQTKTMPPANNRLSIVPAIRKLSHVPVVYKNSVTSARFAAYCSLPLMFITVIRTKLHGSISMFSV